MMLSKLLVLLGVLTLLAGVSSATAIEPERGAANAAVEYILSLQNEDGGFPSFGDESSPGASLDVAFALASAGVDARDAATQGGATLGDYLGDQSPPEGDAGALAKLSFGLSVIGLDGASLIDQMGQYINPETDGYGEDVFDQAFYVFALVAADAPRAASAAYMRSIQLPDGGWEFADGFGSDSNTTAMALQALLAAGGSPTEDASSDAIAYLRSTQNGDGGFGFTAADDSDPNSTGLVTQALVAAGEDIGPGGTWEQNGNTPLDGLLAFQNPGTGAFQYAGEDSPFATYQAIPAVMLAPFPELQTRIVEEPTPVATAKPVTATPTVLPGLPPAGHASSAPVLSPYIALALITSAGLIVVVAITRRQA
jgi:hypothetical protein